MSQPDMFSQPAPANQFSSLDEVIDALKSMKDDPLANAGTNVVVSRGRSISGRTVIRPRRTSLRTVGGFVPASPARRFNSIVCSGSSSSNRARTARR